MANVMRVIHPHLPDRSMPIKGSAEAIQVGDFLFLDVRFQGNTTQMTVRPASAGSTGSSAGDGRYQFANLFAGVSNQRHDLNSYDKVGLNVCQDGEVEALICNSTGTATAATAGMPANSPRSANIRMNTASSIQSTSRSTARAITA